MLQKKRSKLWQIITAIILLALIAPYFYFDSEKLFLNDQTQTSLEGQFINLPDRVVQYERPETANPILIEFIKQG